jgi:DNA-binding transcriptional regulator YdaS (Cro superfamily)
MVEWRKRLESECARASQAKVAKRIGYSPAVINQVLRGSYKGDLQAVQKAVEGALMGATVRCPVLGDLPSNRCLEIQAQPFAATSPTRVMLHHACRNGCPNSRIAREKEGKRQ